VIKEGGVTLWPKVERAVGKVADCLREVNRTTQNVVAMEKAVNERY
jgi:hypothetical protein